MNYDIFSPHAFTHNGKDYEIRVQRDKNNATVQVFCNNQPASPFSYQISWDIDMDIEQIRGISGLELLVELAKRDILEKD